jgi:hypothetical protein
MPTTWHAADDEARGRRHEARLSTRLLLGALIGAALGALIGVVVGSFAFRSTGPLVACVLAGTIGLGGLGAFWGGMAGLESPDPGEEPFQSDHPLRELSTKVERETGAEQTR